MSGAMCSGAETALMIVVGLGACSLALVVLIFIIGVVGLYLQRKRPP